MLSDDLQSANRDLNQQIFGQWFTGQYGFTHMHEKAQSSQVKSMTPFSSVGYARREMSRSTLMVSS